jgi:hypothetical protein
VSVPTVTAAIGLKVAKEVTSKKRDRSFAYPPYRSILSGGRNIWRIANVALQFLADPGARAFHPRVFELNRNWDIRPIMVAARGAIHPTEIYPLDICDTMSHI